MRSVFTQTVVTLAGVSVIALGASGAAEAQTTLTFDELAPQPVDDLSFMGVTFDFKVNGIDSLDASYSAIGPGAIDLVQDPSLEGTSAGILTLDFDTLISELQFGVSLNTFDFLTPGFTVELFDMDLNSLGVTPVDTAPLVSFTEGLFSYTGAPVSRAVIDFDESATGRFAFDNLTFTSVSVEPESVPEPATLLGVLIIAGFGYVTKRKPSA